MFYYVYVLSYKINDTQSKLYIGYCQDLKKRLKRHLNGEVETTKNFKEVKLIYFEGCLNKRDTGKRELQLKTGFGRGYLKRRLETYLSGVS